jgi:hypothetical protein
MTAVYTNSAGIRPAQRRKQTVQQAQMAVFERQLCDERPNPYEAILLGLKAAIELQKQYVKNFIVEEIWILFMAIDDDLERSREDRVFQNVPESQAVSEAMQVIETLEVKLTESKIDVEAIKAQLLGSTTL